MLDQKDIENQSISILNLFNKVLNSVSKYKCDKSFYEDDTKIDRSDWVRRYSIYTFALSKKLSLEDMADERITVKDISGIVSSLCSEIIHENVLKYLIDPDIAFCLRSEFKLSTYVDLYTMNTIITVTMRGRLIPNLDKVTSDIMLDYIHSKLDDLSSKYIKMQGGSTIYVK